jgi:hypothetical protein
MNASEKFLEEGEEHEWGPEEQSVGDGSLIGNQSIVPDLTILGDLKDLANLTFGTRWSRDESSPRPFSDRPRDFRKRRPVRDHMVSDLQRKTSGIREPRENEGHPSRERRTPHFSDRRHENRVVLPPFGVQFYQEDTSFDLLLDEMRKSCKTYELFAVARLILQKPERFVAVVQRMTDREGVRLPLYLSLLDDLIFCSEHEAMAYIAQHHVEEFFDVAEEAMEAPRGRFTCVHRCGITKKLLSAPNYHRYRALLRSHFDAEIYSMPFERFVSRIETTKEESDIQNWIQQMSRRITYTPRDIDEAVTDLAPRDSLDGAKRYLLQYFRDRVLREVMTLRVAGAVFESMPSRAIANAIQFFLRRQRDFPFDTASNLRRRFRKAGFSIYGKGKISYVCAVRRKFRSESDVFELNVQALINFLESCETVTLSAIQENYIAVNRLSEKEVFGELDWLIREGYVIHYDNGTLFLNPKLKPADRVGKAEWRTKDEAEGQSIIQLEKIETAIEKLSDGTLSISPQTTLAVSEDNFSAASVGVDGDLRSENNGQDDGNESEIDQSKNIFPHSSTIDVLEH